MTKYGLMTKVFGLLSTSGVCVCVLATAVHRVAQVKITSLWLNIVSFCVYVCVCVCERERECV